MPKLAVGRTIEAAYGFGLKQFFAVLGIIWFPYVVVIAILAVPAVLMGPALVAGMEREPFDFSVLPGLIGLGLLMRVGFGVAGGVAAIASWALGGDWRAANLVTVAGLAADIAVYVALSRLTASPHREAAPPARSPAAVQ